MTTDDSARGADIPARRLDVEWAELDGEAVLYDPTTQVLHRLNPGAAVVWAACDGITSADEIIRAMDDAHSGSRRAIARDVPAVINRFRRLGLLRSAEVGPAC
jgi:hypothetical protein